MCRMTALTTVSIPTIMRRLVFNQAMIVSMSDGDQKDGAGMTDGYTMKKSVYPYLQQGSQWVAGLNPRSVWMGHVRSASRGTAVTHDTAHPFVLNLWDDHWLYAQHNGGIVGTGVTQQGEPDVDSYRSFKSLAQLMMEQKKSVPEPDIINTWVRGFGSGSNWAFMFMTDGGSVHLCRGSRTLCYMQLDDGLLINTSFDVLLFLKNWLRTYWPDVYTLGKITPLPEFSYAHVVPGVTEPEIIPLEKPVQIETLTDRYIRFTRKAGEVLTKL